MFALNIRVTFELREYIYKNKWKKRKQKKNTGCYIFVIVSKYNFYLTVDWTVSLLKEFRF